MLADAETYAGASDPDLHARVAGGSGYAVTGVCVILRVWRAEGGLSVKTHEIGYNVGTQPWRPTWHFGSDLQKWTAGP